MFVSTTKRRVDQITVKLVTRQRIAFPQDRGKVELDDVCTREVTLGDKRTGGVPLEQGINTSVQSPDRPLGISRLSS